MLHKAHIQQDKISLIQNLKYKLKQTITTISPQSLFNKRSRSQPDPSWDFFYSEFETRFRGSTELISKRLENRYKKQLTDIKKQCANHKAVAMDLGCGHGEFLNLAAECGFETIGIDSSPKALEYCDKHSHKIIDDDILSALEVTKTNSVDFVSLLHVIEHCEGPYHLKIMRESYRVLKPGGCFLVETPSLYSLWVSARQFYLDPTHIKPTHPEYIDFMMRHVGFVEVKQYEFDEVQHPKRGSLKTAQNEIPPQLVECLSKWEDFMYGPMDIALLAYK